MCNESTCVRAFASRYIYIYMHENVCPRVHAGDHSCEPVPLVIANVKYLTSSVSTSRYPSWKSSPLSSPSSDFTNYTESGASESGDQLGMLMQYDVCTSFNEIDSGAGVLGRFSGNELMKLLKTL